MMPLDLAFTAALALLLLVIAWRMPALTRPDLYFAVTVPASFPTSPAGRGIARRYRAWIVVHAAIGLAIALLAARLWAVGAFVGVAWQILGGFAAFLGARARVLPQAVAPTSLREASLAPRGEALPGGWPLQLLPFAALAAAALYLRSRWEELPERFPVHWRLDGTVDRWAGRDFRGVFGPLVLAAVVLASLVLLAWALQRFSRRLRAAGPAGEAERRYRRAILGVLLATEYLLAATFLCTAWLPLAAGPGAPSVTQLVLAPMVATLVFTIAVAWILIRLGQGGTRRLRTITGDGNGSAAPIGDRSPDACWKAGVFYVNPDDPALFVEKRFGLGYTLNFARPAAWAILAAVLLLPLALGWWLVENQ